MGNFFSKKDFIFEKKVRAMESNINKLETKILSSKNEHYNNNKKNIFYFFIIELLLATFLYEKFASSDSLSEKAMGLYYSLFTTIMIYLLIKLDRLFFGIYIKNNENKLIKLYSGLEKLFEERKLETDFEKTKNLLEAYEVFKKKIDNRPSNLVDIKDNINREVHRSDYNEKIPVSIVEEHHIGPRLLCKL
ncbi:hypothetical protein DICPUDRAFT_78880 [Dictyostelium purpureum]|uniref:Uncharacterized protein n=1 Tax=Dictyostelium purpureum TaxID=5786 RepID=F0ZKW1_DICPU|nr:uncharacterized protein DICPUDRAFT_78880 [Dictyostelium purpureum]EGC35445.1 hypothetical protein DICPUDRAFT_78880 [Dictyostelium purpureum]|eukprot:XP_003288058.1 hypothetical protein DICPUDRAFT_78880 [Dictyostelium purpureum]